MSAGASVRVLVVDDQAVVRDGLVLLLGLLDGVEVVGAARDGEEALELVAAVEPQVVLMDLRMPRLDGAEATRRLAESHPDVRVVVLTTHADDASILGALRAGARGYLTKDAEPEELARAIAAAAGGQTVLDPAAHQRLLDAALRAGPSADAPGVGASPGAPALPPDLPDDLTPREGEVLGLIAAGLSNGEIAARLYVSEATVKTHVNHIFRKAGLRDRAQAIRYAYAHGLAPHG